MAKHDEWLVGVITSHITSSIDSLHSSITSTSKMSAGTCNHPAALAGAMQGSIHRKIEDIGLTSLSELIDTDHKKAVIYGMLHQSESASVNLIRRPSNILRRYLTDFIQCYVGFAGAGEQSIIKSGMFDIESSGNRDTVFIRRVPAIDASTRLRYQSLICRHMEVIRVMINEGNVAIGLKSNLSFADFYGIDSEAMRSALFTDDTGVLTTRGISMVALTKPFLQDLMRLTHVLKTIRRVQYERDIRPV